MCLALPARVPDRIRDLELDFAQGVRVSLSVGKSNDLLTIEEYPFVGISQYLAASQTAPQVVTSAHLLLLITRDASSMFSPVCLESNIS